jgi:hypothetical protein
MSDAFMLATGVAALYLVYKVFEQLESSRSGVLRAGGRRHRHSRNRE